MLQEFDAVKNMFSLLLFIPRSAVSRHGVPQESRNYQTPCATGSVWTRIIRWWFCKGTIVVIVQITEKTWMNAFYERIMDNMFEARIKLSNVCVFSSVFYSVCDLQTDLSMMYSCILRDYMRLLQGLQKISLTDKNR